MCRWVALRCLVALSILSVIECSNQVHGPCEVEFWPHPKDIVNGTEVIPISFNSLRIEYISSNVSPQEQTKVNKVVDQFTSTQFFHHRKIATTFPPFTLYIHLGPGFDYGAPTLQTNETYKLFVGLSNNATIDTASISGLIYGLETFSQLILYNNQTEIPGWCDEVSFDGYFIPQAPWIVEDTPRFRWRGLMLDTSRHYLNIDVLEQTVLALAHTKMNVLHLHLTDAQSFPVEFQPPLDVMAKKGSYTYNQRYSAEMLKELQQFAELWGVRIIPEFDSPGHVYSWAYAFPEILVCKDFQPDWAQYCNEPPCGQLNPTLNQTYDVVHGIMAQAGNLFQDEFIHLGYDEVNFNCWNSSEEILRFMDENQMNSQQLLQYYFTNQLKGLPEGKTPVFWEEVFDEGLDIPNDSVIQVWNTLTEFTNVLENSQNPVLLSNNDAWYLDCGMGNFVGRQPSWCDYNSWQNVYLNEPFEMVPHPVPQDYIDRTYGGEVAMWGEMVDATNVLHEAWPRAAAAGERLWSPASFSNPIEALPRILKHRQRLVDRGIPATPIQPLWCNYNPSHCNPTHPPIDVMSHR